MQAVRREIAGPSDRGERVERIGERGLVTELLHDDPPAAVTVAGPVRGRLFEGLRRGEDLGIDDGVPPHEPEIGQRDRRE